MRELKSDHQVIRTPVSLAMRVKQLFAQLRQSGFVLFVDDQLVWIGAAIGSHGHGFATVDELGATLAESAPAAHDFIRDVTHRCSVPTFHRLDRDAIANPFPVYRNVPHSLCDW